MPRPFKTFRPAYMSQNPTHHRVVSSKSTHTRAVTCQEANCSNFLRGWTTTLPVVMTKPCGDIRFGTFEKGGGRHFTERSETRLVPDLRDGHEGEFVAQPTVIFTFPGGQICFELHRKSLDRTPFFYKGPALSLKRQEPLQWLENLGNTLEKGMR